MRNLSIIGGLVAAIGLVGLMSACDRGSGTVVAPSPNPSGPSPNAPPTAVSLEIGGPASIPPGQSAQFTATVRLSDGSTQTATSLRWSSHARVIRVDASGLATAGQQTGEDILSAEVAPGGLGAGLRGSREILVLPDGTYRVVGVVTENVLPTVPLVGARIEVTNAPPNVAVTDWEGRYRLYAVPGTADVRVTRDGYQPHVQRLQLAEHATQNFQLALSGARLDLAGTYTLTIDVTCATSTPVPPDLRHLSYGALLTQSGSAVDVVLTESERFRINSAGRGNRFSGRVDAAGATFKLEGEFTDSFWYFGFPYDPSTYANVVERLSNGTFLIVDGTGMTRSSPAGLSGDLLGGISHHDSRFPNVAGLTSITGACYSAAHRLTLTRR